MNEKIYGCSSVQICQSSPNSQRNYQNGIKNWLFSPNLSLNPRPVSYRQYRRYRKKATLWIGSAIFVDLNGNLSSRLFMTFSKPQILYEKHVKNFTYGILHNL